MASTLHIYEAAFRTWSLIHEETTEQMEKLCLLPGAGGIDERFQGVLKAETDLLSDEKSFLGGVTSQHQACRETTDRTSDLPPRLKLSVRR